MRNPRKPDEIDKSIGRELFLLRKAKKLNQSEVAAMLDVSTQQYGKYERGENRIPQGRYRRLLERLDSHASGFAESGVRYEAPGVGKARLYEALTRIKAELEDCIKELERL